jgi:hypothetical protein
MLLHIIKNKDATVNSTLSSELQANQAHTDTHKLSALYANGCKAHHRLGKDCSRLQFARETP